MRNLVFIIALIFSVSANADSFDEVVKCIRTANAKEVAKWLNNNVELTVINTEGVYSKQQAEIIIKNFFTTYPPGNITINHKGSSAQGSKYAIANYESTQGKFRVYIFMKDSGTGALVHELRFEKE